MTTNHDANLTVANNIAEALYAYATLDLGELSVAESEQQMETCQDIADFVVFALGINSNISENGDSFTASGKFGNYIDLLQNFIDQ